jgi:hypothetical protein
MKINVSDFGVAFAFLLTTFSLSSAQTNREPARPDSSAFDIIEARNIFNADRHVIAVVVPPPTPQPSEPQVQVDYITCVGTMNYEQGPYAFFEGSGPAFQRVLQLSDSIAGCQLAAIESEFVKLVSGSEEFRLPVGAQLRRENGGAWRVVANVQMASIGASSSVRKNYPLNQRRF